MENEETIDVLNTLITINNDRIEGYETAANETKEQDLKSFFNELKQTSIYCNKELSAEMTKFGGTATEGTKTTGKFFRVWMDVKAALTRNDRKAILNYCEYGEDAAKETYEEVLRDELECLNTDQLTMIKAQHTLLVADHNKVKTLRDLAAE